jgi:hypothetical protein
MGAYFSNGDINRLMFDTCLCRFPTSKLLRKKWVEAIKLSRKGSVLDAVCSHHFLTSDYERVRGRTRLKAEVVPSVFQVS